MNDYDTTKAEFDAITRPYVVERISRDTAHNVTPLPQQVAAANREQIQATRGVVLGCSFMALAAIVVVALLGIASLVGWKGVIGGILGIVLAVITFVGVVTAHRARGNEKKRNIGIGVAALGVLGVVLSVVIALAQ